MALQPDNLFTRKNKALALANLKRNAEALAQCDTMLQLNPKYAKAFCYKGFAYTDMKDYPKAIENFEKAVELDPKDSESIGHLIVLYRFTGNNAKADALQQQTGDK